MKHASQSLLWALGVLLLVGASAPAQQKLPPAPFIIADNNPVVVPAGQTSGTVTLEWDGGKDHPYAEVWVRVDQNDETFIILIHPHPYFGIRMVLPAVPLESHSSARLAGRDHNGIIIRNDKGRRRQLLLGGSARAHE